MKNIINNSLKQKRLQLGYSSQDIASIIGVDAKQVAKLENTGNTKQLHNIMDNLYQEIFSATPLS